MPKTTTTETGINQKLPCWLKSEKNKNIKPLTPEEMAEISMAVFFCEEKFMDLLNNYFPKRLSIIPPSMYCFNSFAMYFPTTSNSRLTTVPGLIS
jgi:hypothetical protein